MKALTTRLLALNPNAGDVNPQNGSYAANQDSGQEYSVQAVRCKRPGCAKIGMSIDGTGSTKSFQNGVPAIAGYALRALGGSISKVDVDLWKHGDEDCGEEPVQLVQSGTVEQAIDAIGTIQYQGGGDLEETHAEQVQRLLDVTAWGSRITYCRNVLLMFLTDDTKPLKSGKSMGQLGAEIKAKGVKLILVCQSTDYLQELVNAAGGFLIPISNDPNTAEIQKVMNSLCNTMTKMMTSVGGTIPMSAIVA